MICYTSLCALKNM